uniref:Uncharacterized protein n=1 Tax=Leersia perrieri TaxID=77586 RepID=A0A0D9VKP0_9ORYZ
MDGDAGMIPTSSSAESSPSSSDVDTESTGSSFFRDRSTTLGTLMGVSFADEEEEEQQQQQREAAREGGERARSRGAAAGAVEEDGRRWRRRWRRRRWRNAGGSWWRLCRDDVGGTTSLGQFLHMERQLSGNAGLMICGDERESSTPLFDNGRVTPAREERAKWQLRRAAQGSSSSSSLVRLPVLLTAICSGGG